MSGWDRTTLCGNKSGRAGRIASDTIQWRLIATATDFTVVWLWTGELVVASGMAVVLLVAKTGLFVLWRLWREEQR